MTEEDELRADARRLAAEAEGHAELARRHIDDLEAMADQIEERVPDLARELRGDAERLRALGRNEARAAKADELAEGAGDEQ